MRYALRFLLASLASVLSALLLIALTVPLFLFATTGSVSGEGFWATFGGMFMMLPFVVVIGGVVALPVAMLAGGAMLAWQAGRGERFGERGWLIAGAVAGLTVAAFIGTNDPTLARLFTAPWFALSGGLGAWVFGRIMARGAGGTRHRDG